jgi:N-acetylmuramoyl-L-alanine amidase
MPGALVELGCLTNREEEALLATDTYRERLAEALASGVATYAGLAAKETADE